MRTNYQERLQLPLINQIPSVELYSISGELLAYTYNCIVLGGRGPYIEFSKTQIEWFNFHVPNNFMWKLHSNQIDYVEYRSNKDNIKLYLQKRTVDYAAYKINRCYISPFDLYFRSHISNRFEVVIEKLKK